MKRIISLLLVLVLSLSLIAPVFGYDETSNNGNVISVTDVKYDSAFFNAMNNAFTLAPGSVGDYTASTLWKMMDRVVSAVGYGGFTSYAALVRACGSVNEYFRTAGFIWSNWSEVQAQLIQSAISGFFSTLHWEVQPHSEYGYVIVEKKSGVTLCNSSGAFPYYKAVKVDDSGTETPDPDFGGMWVREDKLRTTQVSLMAESTLSALASSLDQSGAQNWCHLDTLANTYKVIVNDETSDGQRLIYCDASGRPYAFRLAQDNYVVDTDNNYYTDDDGDGVYNQGPTENTTLIDQTNNTIWFPDGTLNYIDNLIYDESTKNYYVDAHQTYNTTNNTYVSNSYNYMFHIDYTSVTYIGTTAEYNKLYEFYYELPDGRSSADLTASDLEQLSLSFKDVINYARSADDLNQRVLYHFDGNTDDSSYWSYCSSFDWSKGASLTYMDEGAFGGSLYLDETEHDFTITLPGNDISGDFTLQFRYYQSYTAAPQTDSYIQLGGTTVLSFTGAQYLDKSGSALASTSVGAWNELCLMRKDGVLYYYVNGVLLKSVSDNEYHSNTIRFCFGSSQQTYKKLDELRFTKAAIYDASGNYTPTAVPYDSNLSLVLPDGEIPLADEVMTFTPSENNLLAPLGVADWTDSGVIDRLVSFIPPLDFRLSPYSAGGLLPLYNPEYTSISFESGFCSVSSSGTSPVLNTSRYGVSHRILSNGLYIPIVGVCRSWDENYDSIEERFCNLDYNKSYCFSVVLSDGTYSYLTFEVPALSSSYPYCSISVLSSLIGSSASISVVNFESYLNEGTYGGTSERYGLSIVSSTGEPLDIIYMELVEGTEPQFSIGWESAVYSSGQLTESPVLAVRSNLDVSTYQIGGVRPSYPTKGQVWALVEGGRITSLQQYTGYAWQSVDGRIWTGSRWVPYYAYDVFLLKDMYDVIEADPSQEYIYTESGFWSWLQKAWAQMMAKLQEILDAIKKIGGGGSDLSENPDDPAFPGESDNPETDDDEGWSFLDLLVALKDGCWKVTKGLVSVTFGGVAGIVGSIVDVGNFFDTYSSPPSFYEEGADVWS